MVDKVDRVKEDRYKEKPRDDLRPKAKDSDFDQALKKSTVTIQPTTPQATSKTATEEAIREAMKREERQDEGNRKEDREKEKGKDSKKESSDGQGRITDYKIVGKGRRGQGSGSGGSGGEGKGQGFGADMSRRGLSKVLQRSNVKSMPVDLRGKFASKLQETAKGNEASQTALSQQVINKMIQYVRIGINMKGEKEIQMELNEKIFRGLKLRVTSKDGKVEVAFRTNDAKGRAALEKNRAQLENALKGKGIDVSEIIVT